MWFLPLLCLLVVLLMKSLRYLGWYVCRIRDCIVKDGVQANMPNWKQYSGYVDVSSDDGPKQLFYWFVESQNNPQEDPVSISEADGCLLNKISARLFSGCKVALGALVLSDYFKKMVLSELKRSVAHSTIRKTNIRRMVKL